MSIKKLLALSVGVKLIIVSICFVLVLGHYLVGRIWRTLDELNDLIKSGNVDARNEDGYTGLMVAAMRGDVELVKKLLDAGASLELKSNSPLKETALYLSVYNGSFANNFVIAKLLIERGADVNTRNANNNTPVHALTQIMQADDRKRMLALLVKNGADINAQNKQRNTMVHLTVELKDFVWIDLILDNFGPLLDLSLKNMKAFTPEQYAWNLMFTDVAELFRDKKPIIVGLGNNVNAKDRLGLTGLMIAVMRNDKDLVKNLIRHGIDVNALSDDEYGNTALHFAFVFNSIPMIQLLLDNKAEIMPNKFGETPMHFVIRLKDLQNQVEAIKLLLARGANINAQNNNRDTLLHVAVSRNNKKLVAYLVDNYKQLINPSLENNKDNTVIETAEALGFVDIVQLLTPLLRK